MSKRHMKQRRPYRGPSRVSATVYWRPVLEGEPAQPWSCASWRGWPNETRTFRLAASDAPPSRTFEFVIEDDHSLPLWTRLADGTVVWLDGVMRPTVEGL